uniref:Uncharacterized protein n=1 Tax=Romanomermis culicivorax TaxID=13658 RepID=A0A915IQJ9_ROMCU
MASSAAMVNLVPQKMLILRDNCVPAASPPHPPPGYGHDYFNATIHLSKNIKYVRNVNLTGFVEITQIRHIPWSFTDQLQEKSLNTI